MERMKLDLKDRRTLLIGALLLIIGLCGLVAAIAVFARDSGLESAEEATPPLLSLEDIAATLGATPPIPPVPQGETGDADLTAAGVAEQPADTEAPSDDNAPPDAQPTLTPTGSSGGGIVVTVPSGGGGAGGARPSVTPSRTPTRQPTNTPRPQNPTPTRTRTPAPVTATQTPTRTPDSPTPTWTLPPGATLTDTPEPIELPDGPIARVNFYRDAAGVPPITDDDDMNFGALKHAEYMAAKRQIAYDEDPGDPLYTPEGNRAAQQGNLWFGNGVGLWEPEEPIDSWMNSPAHRLWILYPKAEKMGYAFVEDGTTGASAAVLEVFGGWDSSLPFDPPLVYPADGQEGVPPIRFGVSAQWPVYTDNPTFDEVSWRKEGGPDVVFSQIDPANSDYMRDYGNAIFLRPAERLEPWTTYVVRLRGRYDGQSFDIEWMFRTGGD